MKGITSILGMIISFVAIVVGIFILGGNMKDFANWPSVMLVVVPTIGSMMATYPMSMLLKIPSHIGLIIGKGDDDLGQLIDKIVDLARKARAGGLLSLENERIDDSIMQYGLRMIVDGVSDEEVKNSLEDSLEGLKSRHSAIIAMYERGAVYAPAFGMCATVISLIIMLMSLDFADPDAINKLGGNMSAALITTFYGSVIANIIFLPIAGRLKLLHKREVFCKTMICNGILAIQRGEAPKVIEDYLNEQLKKETGNSKRAAVTDGGS